jgi:large subunit ribosomal protein L25
MADKIKLKVSPRSVLGRKVKKLRREGSLPANIYGRGIKSLAVQLPVKDFKAAHAQAGETGIIQVVVDKEAKARSVLIHNVHRHPVTDDYLHVDFHQVDLTKKVSVNIPIELVGEAPAVSKGGVLLQLLDEIEVEALPADLPEKFTIDVSQLEEIGQSISLKNIKVDKKKVNLLTDNLDELIVKIEEPAKEEEKPVEPEPEAEAEAEAEEKPEAEGGEPKEGEPAKETDKKEGSKAEKK